MHMVYIQSKPVFPMRTKMESGKTAGMGILRLNAVPGKNLLNYFDIGRA